MSRDKSNIKVKKKKALMTIKEKRAVKKLREKTKNIGEIKG